MAYIPVQRTGYYANFYKAQFSNHGDYIDLVAPRVAIYSTGRYDDYNYVSGTSFSAPVVAGVGGLLRAKNPDLTNEDVKRVLEITARDDAVNPGWDPYLGYGIVNADSALRLLDSHELLHWASEGGSAEKTWNSHDHTFYNNAGLPSGEYYGVEQWKVIQQVDYSCLGLQNVPFVWDRKRGTVGWSGANPNDELTWASVVPGSVTTTGCAIETFVYFIKYNLLGREINEWWPCAPQDVVINCSILSQPSLSAPTNLTASNNTGCDARITLHWQDYSSNEDGFNIYRDGELTGSVGANVTTFTQTGLNPGQTYSYWVRAYMQDFECPSSNTVSITPGPLTPVAPTDLQVVNVGECQFRATWQDNSSNEDGFVLYNGIYHHASLGPNVTSFQGYWYPEAEWVQPTDLYIYAYDGHWLGECKAFSNHVVTEPPGGIIPAPSDVQLHQIYECDWTITWQNNGNYDRSKVHYQWCGCGPNNGCDEQYIYNYFYTSGANSAPFQASSGCHCYRFRVRGGKWVDCDELGDTKWSFYSPFGFTNWVRIDCQSAGCPYLYVQDGNSFIGENTILAPVEMAEDRNIDVTDYYLIKQSVSSIDDRYKLRIAEFEKEYSFFDQVELLAIDHDLGQEVAVTGDGEIFVYNAIDFIEPTSCYEQNGANQDSLLGLEEGDQVYLPGAGSLILNFGTAPQDSEPQILLLPCCGHPGWPKNQPKIAVIGEVTPQIGLLVEVEEDGVWQQVDSIPPRMVQQEVFVSLLALPGKNQDLKIKLTWDERGYTVSKFRCFSGVTFDEPTPLPLENANHSVSGDVTQKLTLVDNEYVELLPDQDIDLEFSYRPLESGKVRDFLFICNGHYETESSPRVSTGTPSSEELQQNYPNPFNPQTQIEFNLTEATLVSLVIYNLLGQKVITLINEMLPAGKHVINWNGEDQSGQKMASGIYFYRLQAGPYDEVRKMALVK